MISQFRKHRLFFLSFGCTLLTLLFFGVNTIAYQALIIEKHSEGQDKLLDYVIELRNELKNYHILPYALADNPTLLAFMNNPKDPVLTQRLQRQLEDLTHVSKTQDWFILSAQGDLLVSSEQSPHFDLDDYFSKQDLSNVLKEQQGEYILVSGYNPKQYKSAHLVLAPVYTKTGLAGAVAVRINVSDLIERWNLLDDLVVMTDQNSLIFLASKLNRLLVSNWLDSPTEVKFLNNTRSKVYHLNDENYLLQNVTLDDLKWQIHYLSNLKGIHKKAQNIAFISLGIFALIFLFWLYRRERSLKIASKLENEILIANSAQRQRVLIENTHVGLLQLTKRGEISFVNPMGVRYFGQRAELNNHYLHEFLPNCPENKIALAFIKSLHTQEVTGNTLAENLLEQEVVLQKEDGLVFPALLSVSSLKWSDSQGYLVTLLDISKRKKAELNLLEANTRLEERVLERTKALEAAQKELLRTEKLAAIGQMSTAIAHELNQPLTGIRTLAYTAELLLRRQDSEQALKTLIDLESLVVRMQKLTSELKVLAYRRPEQLAPTSIKNSIEGAIESLGDDANNVHWEITFKDLDSVIAEPTRLERIFSNLISNSIQACAELKIIPHIKISLEKHDTQITINYQDNGPGIENTQLIHIFEPFFTTKPIGKGLGLGLAISANLAKDMNGVLKASHDDESRLVFRLTLLKA
ncbi:PAS domain S-box protein [Marinomonas rhizomae]|uniref:histidine kinase n=1 Tax=Marinomonas rhizomae TaxID=491948 RepID=A0A366JE44_9GAMM|nr:ATP-binding protein [Marinomonas rhizomae]RBP84138.1 PAS domain S-box-containing protein [Marinomonas rhizomae]RNF74469.1 PAS domain S-box protein [Marinomonas rhizomae]